MFIKYKALIKIYNSILKDIFSEIRGSYSNINSVLLINRWLNCETKLNIKIVFKALR